LIAESIKKALEWAKEGTIEAANHAVHTDKMGMSMVAVAKTHAGLTEQIDDLNERGPVDGLVRLLGRDELVRLKQMRRSEM
jgi:hypothetical protein